MEIKFVKDKFTDKCFFLIKSEDLITFSSEGIANALNLTLEQYLNVLVNEVVRHGYISIKGTNETLNTTFKSKGISNEIYIERFKEAFAPQLTLLAIGDEEQ